MHAQNMAILKGLVTVAWADGKVADEEVELIDALLDAFEATPSEAREIRHFAKEPKGLDDVPYKELGHDDRRVLLQHSVLLTFIDGEQDESERKLLEQMSERLRIPNAEALGLIKAAEERAKASLHLLGN